jgi:hypothetical protein
MARETGSVAISLTNRISCASVPEKVLPVKKISEAITCPTSLGKRSEEPASGTNPSDTNGIDNFASAVA